MGHDMDGNYRTNPFTRAYVMAELRKFGKPAPYADGDVSLFYRSIEGPYQCYMNKAYLDPIHDIPILRIGGTTWMSLTPQEIESHFIPLQIASGRVGVAGLGLGYYVRRLVNKPLVDEVIVYEINKQVIDLYLRNFGKHRKLQIIDQDVREVKGEDFDFFYNDIYPCMLDQEAISDMALLCNNNFIADYHFWTQEYAAYTIAMEGYKLPHQWALRYKHFFDMLHEKNHAAVDVAEFGEVLLKEFVQSGIMEVSAGKRLELIL